MKTIGLLGGMSWESTAVYYRYLNELSRDCRGGLHSAPLLLSSFDFADLAALQHDGDWNALGRTLAAAARLLEMAGAEAVLLCTNTMHKVAGAIEDTLAVPMLHVADAAAHGIKASGSRRPILLGTRFTMEDGFYADRLRERHGIECLIPAPEERESIHHIIYGELCRGLVSERSRGRITSIVGQLQRRGGDGLILGCTELPLLIAPNDFDLPVFDTTRLHAEHAFRFALGGSAAPV